MTRDIFRDAQQLLKKMVWLLPFLALFLLFQLANWCFPLPKARLQPPVSQVVLDRNGEWLRVFLADDGMWRLPANIPLAQAAQGGRSNAIAPRLHQAILTTEDRWFYYHYGINPVSVLTALYDNWRAGEVVRGASTLTMQLARLMEPKARNVPNKIREAFRAVQLEHTYAKSEILARYLNMLPYGGNIVGTTAAARFYFNKPVEMLSLGEAALLAAIPNSPEQLRPDRFPEKARKAREKVLNRLREHRYISEAQLREALQEPIPNRRHPLPFKAPHLSRLLATERRGTPTPDGRIYTTIDAKVQETAARVLREFLDAERTANTRGAHRTSTGAIVVMDTETCEVLAMVGSHDFFDRRAAGQINGTLAPRSPGSALKPFVYALAMEQGLLTPETLLFDVPVNYAGYEPVNFDGKYSGYVTARQALARSLNIPAVNLNARLKNTTLHGFLKQAGITTLRPAQNYGLSLVLGGCEVNLLELTTLYAGLANMGEFRPYRLTRQHPGKIGTEPERETGRAAAPLSDTPSVRRLLREETCFIITEMLTDAAVFNRTLDIPKIAWKTGTSYGHRDAWCVGYSPRFTIGVWMGNFDGKGTPQLSGADAATPTLFRLFTALIGQETHRWFHAPSELKTRQVCALSGAPVSPHCPTHKSDVYLPGVSSVAVCTIHKKVYIDETTGHSLCSHCRHLPPAAALETESTANSTPAGQARIFEEWPADAATWLTENGFAVPVLPPHNPRCTGAISGSAPIILSPAAETTYYIRQGVPLENQKIRLTASASSRTQELFWFLDGELIFHGEAGAAYWLTPVQGRHVVTCVDAEGRSATRPLHISVIY